MTRPDARISHIHLAANVQQRLHATEFDNRRSVETELQAHEQQVGRS